MTDNDRVARGFVTQQQLFEMKTTIELMKQRLDFNERAEAARVTDGERRRKEEAVDRKERRQELDGSLKTLEARMSEIGRELTDFKNAMQPLLDAYTGQITDSREFNRALKISLAVAVTSILIVSILGPAISHAIFGH